MSRRTPSASSTKPGRIGPNATSSSTSTTTSKFARRSMPKACRNDWGWGRPTRISPSALRFWRVERWAAVDPTKSPKLISARLYCGHSFALRKVELWSTGWRTAHSEADRCGFYVCIRSRPFLCIAPKSAQISKRHSTGREYVDLTCLSKRGRNRQFSLFDPVGKQDDYGIATLVV